MHLHLGCGLLLVYVRIFDGIVNFCTELRLLTRTALSFAWVFINMECYASRTRGCKRSAWPITKASEQVAIKSESLRTEKRIQGPENEKVLQLDLPISVRVIRLRLLLVRINWFWCIAMDISSLSQTTCHSTWLSIRNIPNLSMFDGYLYVFKFFRVYLCSFCTDVCNRQ